VQNPQLLIPIDRIKGDETYKYLGVLLDENFNLNKHTDYVCNKLSRALFCINRVKSYLQKSSLRNLYFALFNSHFLYCVNIMGATSQQNIKRIFTLQKKAVHTVFNSAYNAHTFELFKNLNTLPFDKLLVYQRAVFMHSIRYNYASVSFAVTAMALAMAPAVAPAVAPTLALTHIR
jgi:hypothetical protein